MLKNIFIKILILSIFAIILSPMLCASDSYALGDAFSAGKDFLGKGNGIDSTLDTGKLETTSDAIYNTLLGIAVAIAVIVAMVLGIQFMAASADEKAKVKEALMPFVVGCIVVFGSFTIWKAAVNLGNKTEGTIQVGTDAELQEVRQENSDLLARVHNGEIGSFTDAEVRRVYTTNYVDSDLNMKVTKNAAQDVALTLEEAIEDLTWDKKIIYNEAKDRGLLADDGIWLK